MKEDYYVLYELTVPFMSAVNKIEGTCIVPSLFLLIDTCTFVTLNIKSIRSSRYHFERLSTLYEHDTTSNNNQSCPDVS